MKNIFIAFLVILSIQKIYAENNWTFKTGLNISQIRNIENEPFVSISIGIERKIHFKNSFSICPELLLSKQGGIIEDKSLLYKIIGEDKDYQKLYLYLYTADFSIIFDYLILNTKDLRLSLRAFPSYHTFSYEYTYFTSSGYGDIFCTSGTLKGISLNFGALLYYKRFSFDLRYMNYNNNGDISNIDDFKIHSIHFLFGFSF